MAQIIKFNTEMSGRLHLMMFKYKKLLLGILFCVFVLLVGCSREEEVQYKHCGINGTIDVGSSPWSHPNGFNVTLESTSDPSIKHVAVSDANGSFGFQDIEAGTYIINAEKEGYRWVWMVDDGEVNYRDHLVELDGDRIKDISIYFDNSAHQDGLEIIDVNGSPMTRIMIPRNATTISFRLFNGTQTSHTWELEYDRCYVATTFELEYVFTSFNITSGTLASGDNVVLVGQVNPRIFDPQFTNVQGTVCLSDYSSLGNMFNSFEVYIEN